MGTGKQHRWKMKISFYKFSDPHRQKPPPQEFVCLISGSLMADPVIVPSGQTFERCSILACRELGYSPSLPDGSRPDLSSLIPNLALKSAVMSWCDMAGVDRPTPLSMDATRDIVRRLIASSRELRGSSQAHHQSSSSFAVDAPAENSKEGPFIEKEKEDAAAVGTATVVESSERELLEGVAEHPQLKYFYAATEVNRLPKPLYLSSPEELVTAAPTTPLPLATKPSCFSAANTSSSSSSSSVTDVESLAPAAATALEEEIYAKLRSPQELDQEEGLISLRRVTKTSPEQRVSLCTPRLLAALRPLLVSRYSGIQVNSVASLVNLSLEKGNKVQIVRSGTVPPLIDALKGGFLEAQEHAAGAIFSLALDDENKMAIGVLGALPPLLHLLARSEAKRARQDAAMALYHLSLAQANRSKLVKLGAIPILLGLAHDGGGGGLATRALIILSNLAASAEGRAALLDAHAVERLVRLLREVGTDAAMRENCVAVLYALSQSGMRFRGSAKAAGAGAAEVLREVAETGGERAREKAKRMLRMLRERRSEEGFESLRGNEEEEDGGWEGEDDGRDSDSVVAFRRTLGIGRNVSGANSTEF